MGVKPHIGKVLSRCSISF